jgi:hypothetical protein
VRKTKSIVPEQTAVVGDAVARAQKATLGERTSVSLLESDLATAAAVVLLALGFLLPQVCTTLQIILITALILHGSAAWLPAMVVLLLTPTDFKAGGMELQYEKFEGVIVYVFGFPLTASYAIVGAVLVRGLWEWATMPRFLLRRLSRFWLFPIAIGASLCVYSGIVALYERTPSWSLAARATLLLISLWYAIALTRDWPLVREVMMRRMGPLCAAIVASGFFAPVAGIFTCFYLSLAMAWATLISFGGVGRQNMFLRLLAVAGLIACLAVPIGGLHISSAVSEAYFEKLGGSRLPLNIAVVVVVSGLLAFLHARFRVISSDRSAWLAATIGFIAYLAFPFVVAAFSSNKEFDTSGNQTSFVKRLTFKLLVERPAIWRGSIEAISEPPYVLVPPQRSGSIITAGGKRITFRYSAHNLVLEILRSQGFLSGSISLLVLYLCLLACTRTFMTASDPAATIAAITFVVGGLVNGVAVGHLLESGTGFMLYVCAGIAMGAMARKDLLEASRRSDHPPSETFRDLSPTWSGDAARDGLAYQ